MFEVMRGLRSENYSLGVIEITINNDGKGEGMLIAAARVDFTEDSGLLIESFATPFRLLQVQATKTRP